MKIKTGFRFEDGVAVNGCVSVLCLMASSLKRDLRKNA